MKRLGVAATAVLWFWPLLLLPIDGGAYIASGASWSGIPWDVERVVLAIAWMFAFPIWGMLVMFLIVLVVGHSKP